MTVDSATVISGRGATPRWRSKGSYGTQSFEQRLLAGYFREPVALPLELTVKSELSS